MLFGLIPSPSSPCYPLCSIHVSRSLLSSFVLVVLSAMVCVSSVLPPFSLLCARLSGSIRGGPLVVLSVCLLARFVPVTLLAQFFQVGLLASLSDSLVRVCWSVSCRARACQSACMCVRFVACWRMHWPRVGRC